MNDFGVFLRELRGKRSLREMEKITGLSHTYLSSLEKGKDPRSGNERKPSPEVLKKIAQTLDVDYSTLMEKAGYANKKDELEELVDSYSKTADRIEEVGTLYKHFAQQEKELSDSSHIERDELNSALFEIINNSASSRIDVLKNGLNEDINFLKETETQILELIKKRSNRIKELIDDLEELGFK